jgi:hypothetical protein
MDGEFTNYAYAGLRGFDYEPYAAAMRSASAPGLVDAEPPTLTITDVNRGRMPGTTQERLALEGFAADNLAIRAVRWRNDRGGADAARTTWQITSGNYRSGYTGRTHWSIPAIALIPGENTLTLTAEDIKGRTTTRTLRVHAERPAAAARRALAKKRSARRRAQKISRLRSVKRRCLRRARSRDSRTGRRAAKRRCVVRYQKRVRRLRAPERRSG